MRLCKKALEEFISDNLGANRTTRDDWLTHNTEQASEIFIRDDNQLILIADGTYCYIQKSANNSFQRKTYSGQKKRHLVKPFVLCTADGTIVDIYGLYAATVNDAKIMEDVFENDVNLRELIKPDDISIADRGLRDCIKIDKKRFKINVIIPPCTFFF